MIRLDRYWYEDVGIDDAYYYYYFFLLFFFLFFFFKVPSVVKIPRVKNIKLKSNLKWLTFGVIPIDEGASESNLIETQY